MALLCRWREALFKSQREGLMCCRSDTGRSYWQGRQCREQQRYTATELGTQAGGATGRTATQLQSWAAHAGSGHTTRQRVPLLLQGPCKRCSRCRACIKPIDPCLTRSMKPSLDASKYVKASSAWMQHDQETHIMGAGEAFLVQTQATQSNPKAFIVPLPAT